MKSINKTHTPEFRVSFPSVFKPTVFSEGDEPKYQVTALFPKSADLSALKKVAQQVVKEKWGDKVPVNLRTPFLDGDKKANAEGELDPNYAGHFYMHFKSKKKPGVVDQNVQPIMDASEFYGGCYARATVSCYVYGGAGTGYRPGVAFGLQHIQKLRDGEPFGTFSASTPEDDFEPVGDGSAEDEKAYSNEESIF